MTEINLLEPSIADVLKAIEAASGLTASKKTHWSCSLRQVCTGMGRPAESIPGRWSGVEFHVRQLHHARLGCTPKTLANHKANARAALVWFDGVKTGPRHGIKISLSWAALRSKILDEHQRRRLSGLIRFASASGIEPENISEAVLDEYMRYRAETTALASDQAARRLIARAWNACAANVKGWPSPRLIEPPVKALTQIPWEAFPEKLRTNIESYLANFTKIRRGARGKRIRPCKPSTIATRRRELQAFARMAVQLGTPIESLDSLAALVQPDLAEKVLNAYWEQNGEEPAFPRSIWGGKLFQWLARPNVFPNPNLPVSMICAPPWRSIGERA